MNNMPVKQQLRILVVQIIVVAVVMTVVVVVVVVVTVSLISDIAIFVLKRDDRLQPTSRHRNRCSCIHCHNHHHICIYRQRGSVFDVFFVCLLAALRRNFRTDLREIFTEFGYGPVNRCLNFGGDPDRRLDTGIVFRIHHHCEIRSG